jgi:hypothetical protein
MTSKIETTVTILVAVSVILIVIDYVYELSSEQKYFIYNIVHVLPLAAPVNAEDVVTFKAPLLCIALPSNQCQLLHQKVTMYN